MCCGEIIEYPTTWFEVGNLESYQVKNTVLFSIMNVWFGINLTTFGLQGVLIPIVHLCPLC